MVNCPLCDAVIDVEEDELDEGDELTCEECGANLTVISTDPIEIESTVDEDEDDDEDDDDVDDDEDDLEEEDEDEEDDDWK
jgi:alpha-aminoadipate carrier protein LysW